MLRTKFASKQLTSLIAASAVLTMVGVAAMPAVAGAVTAGTTISSVVSSAITISTSTTVNINVTPDANGQQTMDKDTVSVSTNDVDGYTLTVADDDAAVTLASGGNTIAATSGSWASPVDLAVNTWGYRIDSAGSFGAGPTTAQSNIDLSATSLTFAAMAPTGTPQQIKQTATTASNDTTDVWYSVAVDSTKPTGTYTDAVTYSATVR